MVSREGRMRCIALLLWDQQWVTCGDNGCSEIELLQGLCLESGGSCCSRSQCRNTSGIHCTGETGSSMSWAACRPLLLEGHKYRRMNSVA